MDLAKIAVADLLSFLIYIFQFYEPFVCVVCPAALMTQINCAELAIRCELVVTCVIKSSLPILKAEY